MNLTVDMVSAGVANADHAGDCAVLGRIVNVGRLGGVKAEFDFDLHAHEAHRLYRRHLPHPHVDEVREIIRRMRADLWDAVEAGKLELPIDRTFPLAEAAAALAHMRANQHFGKIVLVD